MLISRQVQDEPLVFSQVRVWSCGGNQYGQLGQGGLVVVVDAVQLWKVSKHKNQNGELALQEALQHSQPVELTYDDLCFFFGFSHFFPLICHVKHTTWATERRPPQKQF